MKQIAVTGSFDDLRSRQVRLLEAAARLGEVQVFIWSDELVSTVTGSAPKFPLEERLYLVSALRYAARVTAVDRLVGEEQLPEITRNPIDGWVVDEASHNPERARFCAERGILYTVIPDSALPAFPVYSLDQIPSPSGRKKVVVTGCFDWLHSGHVRFFEEVSELGELYVVVGSDENVELLKGKGHPLFSQDERRYLVQSVRFVHAALISSGQGWMDAEPEIELIQPDIYAVNEDGDKPEKRAFCAERGLEYAVLKRLPRSGLPTRESTVLRGF